MPRTPVRDWFTTHEVAEMLNVSVPLVKDFIKVNRFPHSEKTDKVWLIYKGDIEKVRRERAEKSLKRK